VVSRYIIHNRRGNGRVKVAIEGDVLVITPEDGDRTTERLPLDEVRVMRLNPPVRTKYGPGHFLCTLVDAGGRSTLLRAEAGDADICREYGRLVADLHDRFTHRPNPPRFMTGLGSIWSYIAIAGGTGIMMGFLIALAIYGTIKKGNYGVGFAFVAGTIVITFFLMRFVRALLKPMPYDPARDAAWLTPPSQ